MALLPILTSCVEKLGAPAVTTLVNVWALERVIARLTERPQPKDVHILLNAMEAREKALREELAALEKAN